MRPQRTSALSPRRLCSGTRTRAGSTSSALPLAISTLSTARTRAHTDVPPSPESPAPDTPVRARDMFDSLALKLKSLPSHADSSLDIKAAAAESPKRRPFASLFISPPMPIPALPTPVLSGGTFAVSCARAALPDANRRRQYLLPLIFLAFVFVVTSVPVIWGIMSLPIHSLHGIPTTLREVALLGRELQAYADSGLSGKAHVLGVLSIVAVWKHAFSIPGSVLLNVLGGALLSPALGTLVMTALTTIGSIGSSLLSAPLTPLVRRFVPRPLHLVRSALEGHDTTDSDNPLMDNTRPSADHTKTPTWVRLTVMRLVGVVPWSGINIACGVCEVPLTACALGAFFGTLPWTAVTCQIGDILQAVASQDNQDLTLKGLLTSPTILIKLAILSLLSLGPVLARERLVALLTSTVSRCEKSGLPSPNGDEKEKSHWRWSRQNWRRNSEHDNM
ncbi:Golgi apparatus membrane protein TVP38 [Ceratobasidium sp. AG-Ba]|nr:Golgi apparatus membrane protein TVP38 [Ceratobasidium sp. AG-Ba]